ncbi:hypothetical protein RFI_04233 [Reticulomyxa filosa]|uniref:NACHT domain-containing protein n=1 Tax=Reticulomyxa filosa TaxID=46433 RepID=X6P498_RETFI|nr:hypothetical protein RFI_04233 [Reticulomyxa filosa]|eukprot:ETO32884.1 hypothetical protein RFI_04233 [Reticulomyxa filosa]
MFVHLFVSLTKMKTKKNFDKGNTGQVSETDEKKLDNLQKEKEHVEIGEVKPGINLQGNCTNGDCLAAKGKLLVWVNIGFNSITFTPGQTSFACPDCEKLTVTSVVKAMLYNAEHSIGANGDLVPVKDNNYQCLYTIKPGIVYEISAKKIRQHAHNIEDLRERSENAMNSTEITNLVTELQRYEITVVKPPSLKGNERLLEKIQADYDGDFNQAFDIGRFTILCDNPTKLQTAVAVMKKAEQFNLVVSEDKDFFEKQSKTHHRFHNIKLYVPKYDVYIEMQATLKSFTTLEGYTIIENPKLSHLFYEHIRAWKPNNSPKEEELKQASDETLIKINDIICEWINEKEIKKIASRYKPNTDIGVLKPPQLKGKTTEEINTSTVLKLTQFVYAQLCSFTPAKLKGRAIYVILFEYFKKHVMGDTNPASHADITLILQQSRKQELEEDTAILQALEIRKKSEQPKQVMILQGKSGSGKSLFCRHLEETLWEHYVNDFTSSIPVYISLPKCYNPLNEQEIISQALQMKQINKEVIDIIQEAISFVFIIDGFDEVFDNYNKSKSNETKGRYFYDRFDLSRWNAKFIVTCRSHVLNEEDIKQVLLGPTMTMAYLWPFSNEKMHAYIEKFVNMTKKSKIENSDWTPLRYAETLKMYPNLHKMVEEPFLLRLILTVLPELMKRHLKGTNISRTQVYEAFNEQWISLHIHKLFNKLAELRIQISFNKMKITFQKYCEALGFEMFLQSQQIATERILDINSEIDIALTKADPDMDIKSEKSSNLFGGFNKLIGRATNDDANETKMADSFAGLSKHRHAWDQYFQGDSLAKYLLRRIGENQYSFLHKSFQEYFAAHAIIYDLISWQPTHHPGFDNHDFQQQFQEKAHTFKINSKLLNEDMEIIYFIVERIRNQDANYVNLKSRLFRIIEASKTNQQVQIGAANAVTILNAARVNLHNQNWDNIQIPHAILDTAFLEGTSLANANLEHVSFLQAYLCNTNLRNAKLKGIDFGEYSYLEGHSDAITSIQYSPDCRTAVSSSKDLTIRIWDMESRKEIQKIVGHTDVVNQARYSPDGKHILSCSADKTIRIWDVTSGKMLKHFELENNVTDAQYSSNGHMVAACSSGGYIQFWDLNSDQVLSEFKIRAPDIQSITFSPDDSMILGCFKDKMIRLLNIKSKEEKVFEGHSNSVNMAQYSPNKRIILSCSSDKTIRIWDIETRKEIQKFEGHLFDVNTAQFSPDGRTIVSCSRDRTIRIWDVESGRELNRLEGHSTDVTGVLYSSNGSTVLSCSQDKTIRIWDASIKRKLVKLDGHSGAVKCVRFSPDGRTIASGSADTTIRIWDQ